MPHDVFVSYSSADKPMADAVVAWLESAQIRCWAAPRDIHPGADWGAAIIDAIKDARLMVVVFSVHANASPQVLREVERAVNRGLPVIPFKVDSTLPSGSMEYFLSTPHWLDAVTPPIEQHLHQLIATAQRILAVPLTPRPVPPPPLPWWRRYAKPLLAASALVLLALAWFGYRASLPVDPALVGTWRGPDRMMIGTVLPVEESMEISSGGAFRRTSRFRIAGPLEQRESSYFKLELYDLKGYIQGDGTLSTPTCCFLVNSLPNYAFSLPNADQVRGHKSPRNLLWRAAGDSKWTTTYSNYGIDWQLSLALLPGNRLELTATAVTNGKVSARDSAFILTSPNGKTTTSTYQLRGGTLFLDGVHLGNWVRLRN